MPKLYSSAARLSSDLPLPDCAGGKKLKSGAVRRRSVFFVRFFWIGVEDYVWPTK
jgi:hypothetical protein